MTRIRTLFALLVLAIAVPAVVAGCGGSDDSTEDPQTVLDETFNNDTQVNSGDLSLSASIKAEGDQGGSFEASLSGPFEGNTGDKATIPQLDWTGSLSGEGGGQSIDFSGGVVVTDDNAYVEYKDQAYEVGSDTFSQLKDQLESQAQATGAAATGSFKEQCENAIEQAGGDASACDIDLQSWLTNLSNDGTEDVGGTETVHISGDANVDQMLSDIGNLAESVPGASSQGIDAAQIGQISGAITDASIDVYSGADDHVLRKLDLNLTVDPSAVAPEGVSLPVSTIEIAFSVEIDGLNEDQTIEAPSDAKPISDLLSSLGVDAGSLGAIPGVGSSGSGSSGSGSGNGDAYLQCVQQATTPAEINDCASQL